MKEGYPISLLYLFSLNINVISFSTLFQHSKYFSTLSWKYSAHDISFSTNSWAHLVAYFPCISSDSLQRREPDDSGSQDRIKYSICWMHFPVTVIRLFFPMRKIFGFSINWMCLFFFFKLFVCVYASLVSIAVWPWYYQPTVFTI